MSGHPGEEKEGNQEAMNSYEGFIKAFDFTGQTVVITGGAGVLGGEMACALTGCGAQVAILDLNLEPGKALLERMASAPPRPNCLPATCFRLTA